MGIMMSCCAAEALCCVVSGSMKCCGLALATSTRLIYTFGLVLVTIVSWVLSKWGAPISVQDLTPQCDLNCWRYFAVDRISFAFVLYHSFLCLLMLGVQTKESIRAQFNNGFWPVKFLLLLGPMVGAFFIPIEVFGPYWIASFVFSCLFIVIQSIILVDFAWEWSSHWVHKMEESPTDSGFYKFLLIFGTILSFAFVFTITILLYVYYGPSHCHLNLFFITFNLLLVLAFTIISILGVVREKNHRAGLFQSAILGMYVTYLTGSAINGQPPELGCYVGQGGGSGFSGFIMVIGVVIVFLALGYQAFSAGGLSEKILPVSGNDNDADDKHGDVEYNYSWFHFIFVLSGFYMAAVLTNWATSARVNTSDPFNIGQGYAAMWIKMSTGWLCSALYVWTLLAPLIFPDRDFS